MDRVAESSALAALIESMIDRRVEAKIAALTGTLTGAEVYRSRGGILPPGCKTSRAMATKIHAYSIPHTIEGSATRAVYVVPVTAWHAALRRPAKVKAAPVLHVVQDDDEALADAALGAAGLRATRCAR